MEYQFKQWQPPGIQRGHLNLGGMSPNGGTIEINSLYLERDNKPWIGVMGEFHYSRCERSQWHDRLAKMKAGGITIVSTYLLWIYHEEEEGIVDFSNDNDIRSFILECQSLSLDVIIRIGPWCHAECRNGGLPDWLLTKSYKLREANQPFLDRVRLWYKQIAEQVNGLFYRDGGNIIGVQLENELVGDADYLYKLKEIAIECGMIAPIYTVTGWNSVNGAKIPVDEVLPVFGGYCDVPWEESTKPLKPSVHYFFNQQRNDSAIGNDLLAMEDKKDDWVLPYDRYPFATCELGGGLHGTHHRRYIIKGMDIYALSLIKLGVGNNLIGYYMYCGGTNKIGKYSTLQESTMTGYANDYPILSYDFQGPVSEYGEIREQYRLLNLLHLFVQDFGEIMAPMSAVDALVTVGRQDISSLRYGMRRDDSGGFVFINHYQRRSALTDLQDVVIDTGIVKFPPINVFGEICFFMPFHLKLDGCLLEYGTVQPICRSGSTFFFAEIPGIPSKYRIDGEDYQTKAGMQQVMQIKGINLVTLSLEEARYIRRLHQEIYVGIGCDLYENQSEICSAAPGSYRYAKWNQENCCFERYEKNIAFQCPCITLQDTSKPEFKLPYLWELNMGGGRKVRWKKIEVSAPEGLVEIPLPECDAMQIYVDGELAADDYYCGRPWRIPGKMLYGKECYLAYSSLRNDCYHEFFRMPEDFKAAPATLSCNSVTLVWDKPEGYKDIVGYTVYQDEVSIGQTSKSKTHFTVSGLCANTTYEFRVEAVTESWEHAGSTPNLSVTTMAEGQVIDITKPPYSADAAGASLSTKQLQKAIDCCPAGGTVLIPKGAVILTGAIDLKSDMTLKVDGLLKGSLDPEDYTVPEQEREGFLGLVNQDGLVLSRYEGWELYCYRSLINAGRINPQNRMQMVCENIRICGSGTIYGGGNQLGTAMKVLYSDKEKYPEYVSDQMGGRRTRGRLICFMQCKNVHLTGVGIENPPCWTVHMIYCDTVTTHGVNIKSRGIDNGDGWDPDSSRNLMIFDTSFDTGDDCIAIKSGKNPEGNVINIPTKNVRIFDLKMLGGNGMAIGSEQSGGVEGIYLRDCVIRNTNYGLELKAQRARGGYIKKLRMADCEIDRFMAHSVNYNADGESGPSLPYFQDIEIKNTVINGRGRAVELIGFQTEERDGTHDVQDVILENITLGTVEDERKEIYLESCHNVILKNVVLCNGTKGELITDHDTVYDISITAER